MSGGGEVREGRVIGNHQLKRPTLATADRASDLISASAPHGKRQLRGRVPGWGWRLEDW